MVSMMIGLPLPLRHIVVMPASRTAARTARNISLTAEPPSAPESLKIGSLKTIATAFSIAVIELRSPKV